MLVIHRQFNHGSCTFGVDMVMITVAWGGLIKRSRNVVFVIAAVFMLQVPATTLSYTIRELFNLLKAQW
jgi:hypothetical protein